MNWFYATQDKKQAGPVDDATLKNLLLAGTISNDTLVWKEGMANWTPYSSIATLQSSTASPLAPGTNRCAECGQTFAPDQLISLGGRPVCAACKPVAVQKLQEGVVTFGETMSADELGQMVQQRGYDFTIGSILSRSWNLVKGNFWPCLGVTLLCYLIMAGSNQIPLIGILAVFLVQPQIMAGLNLYFLKQFRNQPATLNDAFDGFRRGFGHQALYMLIVFAIMLVVGVMIAIPMAILIPNMSKTAEAGGSNVVAIAAISVVTIPIFLAIMYFMMCWMLTPLLILDKGLKAIPAMKLSRQVVQMRFWKILGLFLVVGLLALVSAIPCGLGLLVMLPVGFAVISRLYEDIFGEQDGSTTR